MGRGEAEGIGGGGGGRKRIAYLRRPDDVKLKPFYGVGGETINFEARN